VDWNGYQCMTVVNGVMNRGINQRSEQFSKLIFNVCCFLHVSNLVVHPQGDSLYAV
jgi:hypothetical protein